MPHRQHLGRRAVLPIDRITPHGAFLALTDEPEGATILLPGADIPQDAGPGTEVDVMVYLDSRDRPIATTAKSKLQLGEVAFLEITDMTSFGAFVDWGLPKELLVPFAEQSRELEVGERHPIGLTLDNSDRLTGTMKVAEMLRATPDYLLDEWVMGEAWRYDPSIGLFAILDRHCVGLLPSHEPHNLSRGERARFRITRILEDGKVELSLRKMAGEAVVDDAAQLLQMLELPDPPRIGDRSSPQQIRDLFGMSKKAFKRATGRLLKQGKVAFNQHGYLVRTPDQSS